MNREEISILIERYLDGELSVAEKLAFEGRLDNDEKFKSEFEFHLQLRRNLTWVIQKEELQAKMNKYHRESGYEEPSVIFTGEKKVSFMRLAMVAASVSLIICTSAIAIYHFSNTIIKQKEQDYQTLSRTEDVSPAVNEKSSAQETKESVPAQTKITATAFAITVDGYMLTNYHVVKGKGKGGYVYVEQKNDTLQRYVAEVIDFDKKLDIAILKVKDPAFKNFDKIPFVFASNSPSIGQKVFTLGYPKNEIVYNEGPISSLTGYNSDTNALQFALPVNPGNSGAPVFTENGEIVGVLAGKNSAADGEAYGIKINYINDFLKSKEESDITINSKNLLKSKKVTDQVKELQKFIFIIKA